MNCEYLIGYTDGGEHYITPTTEQLVAFIMEFGMYGDLAVSTCDGKFILDTFGILINKCPDKDFLFDELHLTLIPVQIGDVEPPKYVPYEVREG